jgi:hypothetical protein
VLSYNRKSNKIIEKVSFTMLTTQHASQDKSDDQLTFTLGSGKTGTNVGIEVSTLMILA